MVEQRKRLGKVRSLEHGQHERSRGGTCFWLGKENRTLAEQPKVKVYGKKDKRIGDMLGIVRRQDGKCEQEEEGEQEKCRVPAADVAKKTLEERLEG